MLRVLPLTFKPVKNQICCKTGLNVGGKTRNIAIQLVLQQCCKTSCTFFVARFSVPLSSNVFDGRTSTGSEIFSSFIMP